MNVTDHQTELALLVQKSNAYPTYKSYQPLHGGTNSIRLLHIELRSDGEIYATITHASLDDEIEYEALSYCWGPPDVPKTIYVDREALSVRSSLYTFLHTLCQNGQPLPIWIDTICIDQCNVQERNWQVSIMDKIYHHAVRVKSWLGPSDAYCDYAFAYMYCYRDEALLSSDNLARAKKLALEGFQIILDRPYWKRLWIMQEVALAKQCLIFCGNRTISLEHFLDVLKFLVPSSDHIIFSLCELRRTLHILPAGLDGVPRHADGRSECRSHTGAEDSADESSDESELIVLPGSLLGQISKFGSQACEDIRDKIFGLRGFATDGDQLIVDYAKPFADVLTNVIHITYRTWYQRLNDGLMKYFLDIQQKSGHLQDLIDIACLMDFGTAVAYHLETITSDIGCQELLASVSNTETQSGILYLAGFICAMAPKEDYCANKHSGLIMVDGKEWTTCSDGSYACYSTFNDTITLIEWKRHRVPEIVGFYMARNDYRGTYTAHDPLHVATVFRKLIQIGEIQLCSQACLTVDRDLALWDETDKQLTHRNCRLFVHISPYAILALVCVLNAWQSCREITVYLRNRRVEHPRPQLCKCKVSEDINAQAYDAYLGNFRRRNFRRWRGTRGDYCRLLGSDKFECKGEDCMKDHVDELQYDWSPTQKGKS